MTFQALDVIAALAAQHVADLFDSDCACECPRCCMACRAVNEVITGAGLTLGSRLRRLGIEDYLWQNPKDQGFDGTMIRTKWHDPCPVYEELDP